MKKIDQEDLIDVIVDTETTLAAAASPKGTGKITMSLSWQLGGMLEPSYYVCITRVNGPVTTGHFNCDDLPEAVELYNKNITDL